MHRVQSDFRTETVRNIGLRENPHSLQARVIPSEKHHLANPYWYCCWLGHVPLDALNLLYCSHALSNRGLLRVEYGAGDESRKAMFHSHNSDQNNILACWANGRRKAPGEGAELKVQNPYKATLNR